MAKEKWPFGATLVEAHQAIGQRVRFVYRSGGRAADEGTVMRISPLGHVEIDLGGGGMVMCTPSQLRDVLYDET